MYEQVIKFFFAFFFMWLVVKILHPLSYKLGLVDHPGGRKQHDNCTPMIGGVSIFLTLAVSSLIWGKLGAELCYFLLAAVLIVYTGVCDDRTGLRVRFRFLAEVLAACMMIFGAGVVSTDLGDLLGFGNIQMPIYIAVPFTIVAVFGTINCLNMIDGLDGLAAGLCLLSMCTFDILTGHKESSVIPVMAIVAGLIAFLIFNLQMHSSLKKIFLGDAGAMFLGFTMVWLFIQAAQNNASHYLNLIEPVTALYVLGLPLFDMVATTIRRFMVGTNPVKPDRTHVHHILQDKGYSSKEVLVLLLLGQLVINLCGVVLHTLNVQESIQFYLFLGLFVVYFLFLKHLCDFKADIKHLKHKIVSKLLGPRDFIFKKMER